MTMILALWIALWAPPISQGIAKSIFFIVFTWVLIGLLEIVNDR